MKSKYGRTFSIGIVGILGMLSIVFLTSQKTDQKPPEEKVLKFKESTITQTRNVIGGVYKYLDESNLPQQEVKNLKTALAQADAAIQKDLSDSTLNVPKK